MTAHRRLTLPLVTFVSVVAVVMAYAMYTQSAWEDWYITYRGSKNLALGHGLVFDPGQRVHTFTSPLGTLLPAFLSWVTGNTSDDLVLWLFRFLSSCAFGVTAVLLLQLATVLRLSRFVTAVLLLLVVGDAKTLEFSTSGMETAFCLLFVAAALRGCFLSGRAAIITLGVGWAGLMWSRPDGFVLAGGMALGFLAFCPTATGASSRLGVLRAMTQAGVLGACLYLPWMLWAWSYYGSPIPHPAVAKSLDLADFPLLTMALSYPLRALAAPVYQDPTFLPTYHFFGGWPRVVTLLANLSAVGAWYWLVPVASRGARAMSVAFACGNLYVTVFTLNFPWYFPPVALLGYLVCACAIQDALNGIAHAGRRDGPTRSAARLDGLVRAASGALVAFSFAVTLGAAWELRIQQQVIEEGHRKQIGLWLRDNSGPGGATVYLEPIGYIGFFSGLKMYDYPGLTSPEVIAARRELGNDWGKLIRRLEPEWVVLRPSERARIEATDPTLLRADYTAARTFDVSERVRAHRWIPGRSFLEIDQRFEVFRRGGPAARGT